MNHKTFVRSIAAIVGMALCICTPKSWAAATATTTTLTITSGGSTVTTVTAGSVVTLTATLLAGGAAVTPGQVNFCDASAKYCTDIHLLGTAQLTSAGTAVLKFRPGVGSHSYNAVFVGTTKAAASTSSTSSLTVSGIGGGIFTTATTLNASGNPGNYTVTAKVTGLVNAPSVASPSGTVSFLDTINGEAVLGTSELSAGVSGLSWTEPPSSPPTGAFPNSVAMGDFNGDGMPDVAVSNGNDNTVTILLGKGDGTFTAAPSWHSGGGPILVADLNGDGKPDMVIADSNIGNITILLGNGDGTFTAAPNLSVAGTPSAVALGDFNKDGIEDLAVTNYSDNTLAIFLGNGDGTFTRTTSSPVISNPQYSMISMAVGDFNKDGNLDLAIASYSNGTVSILLGDGTGGFTPAAASPKTGSDPQDVVSGDFNGDGKPDLAISNSGDGTITILLSNGDGTFNVATALKAGNTPIGLAVADFNLDGKADLVVSNELDNTVEVFLGKGDGTFVASGTSVTWNEPLGVAAADIDGDGIPDLMVACPNYGANGNLFPLLTHLIQTAVATASNLSPIGPGQHLVEAHYPGDTNYASSDSSTIILYEQPPTSAIALTLKSNDSPVSTVKSGNTITLTATVTINGAPVTSGDVNFCDATAASCSDIYLLGAAQLTSAGTATLNLIPGIGSHSYKAVFVGTNTAARSSSATATLTVTGSPYPTTTTLAQSGSAGNYTLTATVVGTGGVASPTGTVSFLDTSDQNSVLGTAMLGTGTTSVSFAAPLSLAAAPSPQAVLVGDFNGDGKPDLAIVNSGDTNNNFAGSLTVLLNNGSGTYTAAASPAVGTWPVDVVAGDFNGDGKLDLAVVNSGDGNNGYAGTITILLGNGDGTFTATAASPATGAQPVSAAVGDFNGDGKLDLAVANYSGNTVTVLLGNGDGTFTPAASLATGNYPSSIVAGDFNGDGKLDLAITNSQDYTVTVLLGNGDGTFTPTASPATGTNPWYAAVGDFNGDGKPDIAVANAIDNTLTILLGNGDGTFTAADTPATGKIPVSIAVGDFNADGKADLAVANQGDNTVAVLLGNGDGAFTSSSSPTAGNAPVSVATGHMNEDGTMDVVTANYGDNTAAVLLTQLTQTTTATASNISPLGTGTHQVEASYPGDTYYATSTSSTVALSAQTAAPKVTVSPSTNSISATQALSVAVTVSDGTSNPTPTGTVTVTSGSYTSSATALSSGTVTINIPAGSLVVGSDTLTATYTPDNASTATYASATGTATVTVTQASPTPVIRSLSPAFTNAGSAAFTLTVNGSGFVLNSTVYFGATALSTQFGSATKLTAQVPATDVATSGAVAITVQTPNPGGGISNPLKFEIDSATSGTPPPTFTTVSATVTPGSSANYPVTLPSPATNVSVTCLNLPTGASCSYSATTGAVTIATTSATPAGTYQIVVVFTETLPGAAAAFVFLPVLLLPLVTAKRKWADSRIWLLAIVGMLLTMAGATAGCGGGAGNSSTPSQTHPVTSSGAVSLTVQ